MPRISVVVPVHNVAAYVEPCLESLARQSMEDLEIVLVDDGSTDESPVLAERFAARDGRFRLLRQANAGQGAARNNGIGHATGELLAFVDGDDVVPPRAYEVLAGALARSGSDFATGRVRRLTSLGTTRAAFLAGTFERERLATHVTRFPSLVADRLTCNKLFRRSFWDRHELRFPEGVRNEDIQVMIPAHHLAESVDVVPQTVYLWRRREGGGLSGSQRRAGEKVLRHRVNAVNYVSRFLAERGMDEAKLNYDRNVLGDDLRSYLNLLDSTDDEYRRLFLELANDFLDRADARALDQPLAIERLKWHLVRRSALPELLEVLRFQQEDLEETPPVRRLWRWYGDYPYRGERRLGIPGGVYRLDDELALVARVEDVRWDGGTLRIEGYAYIAGIGAPGPRSQRIEIVARRRRSRRSLRLRTKRVHRPDVTAAGADRFAALDWCGFVATLDAGRLRQREEWLDGIWEIGIAVRAGGVVRRSKRLRPAPLHGIPLAEAALEEAHLRAGLSRAGRLTVRIDRQRPLVRSCLLEEGVLRLEGDAGPLGSENATLHVRRRDGVAARVYPVEVERTGSETPFLARVPIPDLVGSAAAGQAPGDEEGDSVSWDVYLSGDGREERLLLDESAPDAAWTVGGREIALQRARLGGFTILERTFRPVVTGCEWSTAGALVLSGSFRGPPGAYELVVADLREGEAHAVPLEYDDHAGQFTAELTPGSVDSLAGPRPLPEGTWQLLVRLRGGSSDGGVTPILGRRLLDGLPLSATVGRKRFHFGVAADDRPLLAVERDLADDERGPVRQRRLRTRFYAEQRMRPFRDAVLYDSFGGREYSDSPRAIHEELARRDAPFEHLWVVRDGAYDVPDSGVAVRELSEEYYEAFARARYVVASDPWPRWSTRRPEQTWLQTWHGAPLKRLGRDLAGRPRAVREYRRALRQPSENWQYIVSPGLFATPILQRAFSSGAEVIETGLPRTDVLLQPDREQRAADVRRRLGLSPDRRVVLYAPTYRDHLAGRHGYHLGPLLDLAALRSALGSDDVLLFRKHRLVVGALPEDTSGLVLDVSAFPDGTELLLAADVLVTDYSSAIFDFASTNRPIVFFTPDLETYRDEIRGFSIDFESVAPGPLLETTEDVIDALRQPEVVRVEFGERYDRFVETYCALNDGRAASRVVDRIFRW
jgi:CDP-glycerol glycerophosphotransferase